MTPGSLRPRTLAPATLAHTLTVTLALAVWLGLGVTSSALAAAATSSTTPIADAAERTDLTTVRSLLKENPRAVHLPQPDGMTALHWAAHHEHLPLARLLLKAGAQPGTTNLFGITPLSIACANGNTELVELLLDAGADPNTTQRGGETMLMIAARTGRTGPVEALLRRGARPDARERRGQTALMWAAAEGHAQVLELLLKAGAEFKTALPDSGFTPLLFAVREGRSEAVATLLKAGADVNEAMQPGRPSGKGPKKGTSPLLLAVENGHFELALRLVDAGADPNDQRSGFTPLHTLTWVRKPNRGDGDDGDPAPIGSGNLTSLQFARQLIARGAQVNARLERGRSGRGLLTRKGATPFLLACATADLPYMKLLLEAGADPSIPNADNSTPLMAAAGLGTQAPTEEAGTEPEVLEAMQLLFSLGADPNATDAQGETAMHGAAYKNLPLAVAQLAAKGARIDSWNRTNRWGWTPIQIAEGHRVGNFKPSPETVTALHRILLDAGITPPPPTPRSPPARPEAYPAPR